MDDEDEGEDNDDDILDSESDIDVEATGGPTGLRLPSGGTPRRAAKEDRVDVPSSSGSKKKSNIASKKRGKSGIEFLSLMSSFLRRDIQMKSKMAESDLQIREMHLAFTKEASERDRVERASSPKGERGQGRATEDGERGEGTSACHEEIGARKVGRTTTTGLGSARSSTARLFAGCRRSLILSRPSNGHGQQLRTTRWISCACFLVVHGVVFIIYSAHVRHPLNINNSAYLFTWICIYGCSCVMIENENAFSGRK